MNTSAAVGHKAVAGTAYLGMSQGLKVLINILSVVVTARLLDPHEYGVAAMAAPISGFILIFQELGLNQAVVQSKSMSPSQTNALFWVNIVASGVISCIFLLLSPLVGLFYHDIRPGQVMAASAVTVLITGLSLQHTALLNREMKFKQISLVDIANSVTVLTTTVVAAYLLRSFWAIWIGTFCAAIVNAIMVWSFSGWRPNLKPSFKGTRSLIGFGANITGFNLFNYFARNADYVLIAKIWGAAAVGLYDRSYKLMMFPLSNINAPLGRVMLPILARLNGEPERYRNAFLMAVRALMLVSLPGVIAAASTSERLVPFLLGERWSGASPIFFWLSLAALMQPLGNATGWLFISGGRTRQMMIWGLFSSLTSVAAFCIGVRWGPVGVAMAYMIGQLMRVPILFVVCTRGSPVTARDLYGLLAVPAVAGLITYAAVRTIAPHLHTLPLVICALLLSYLLNFIGQVSTTQGRHMLTRMWALGQSTLLTRFPRFKTA